MVGDSAYLHTQAEPGAYFTRFLPSSAAASIYLFKTAIRHRVRSRVYVCTYGHTYSKSMDQPSKVANPARGQLNREK